MKMISNPSFHSIIIPFLYQSCREGAQPVIHCAVSDEARGHNGAYFSDCKVTDHTFWVSKLAYDEGLAKKLWDMSERVTGLDINK